MAAGESKRLAEIDGKGRSEPLAEGPLDEADAATSTAAHRAWGSPVAAWQAMQVGG